MPYTAATPRILYVEDDEGLGLLLQKRMARHNYNVTLTGTGEEALRLVRDQDFAVILLDYTLPSMDGLEVLKALHPVAGTPPVIMLTAGGNEYLAVEALSLGAEDYIIKDVNQTYLDFLPHVINAAINKLKLTRENIQHQDNLHYYVAELESRNTALQQEILERQELEDALRDAKNKAEAANVAKSEFLTNMSHEIRTPMNAVIGLANLLSISQPLTGKQRDYIQTLQISADALLALINDILDISRIEARSINLERIPFDLAQIMHDMSTLLSVKAEEKDIAFAVHDRRAHKTHYHGDPTRLQQIILNLCSNGIKFTDHGRVDVYIDSQIVPHDPEQHLVTLSVHDTGIGIAPEKLATIFEKFIQADSSISRKYGGTGLGLAITKTLAEMMDGALNVTSQVGRGSVFTVTIPFASVRNPVLDVDDTMGAHLSAVTTEKKPCVLIVEDYAPNILVASTFLEEFGYDYDIAHNGHEALAKIKSLTFDAVLMDVQMQSMDGLETTRHVRAYEIESDLPRLPIIGMTAHALTGDREKCLAAGMDDYLPKPFNPDHLRDKLARFVSLNV